MSITNLYQCCYEIMWNLQVKMAFEKDFRRVFVLDMLLDRPFLQ